MVDPETRGLTGDIQSVAVDADRKRFTTSCSMKFACSRQAEGQSLGKPEKSSPFRSCEGPPRCGWTQQPQPKTEYSTAPLAPYCLPRV